MKKNWPITLAPETPYPPPLHKSPGSGGWTRKWPSCPQMMKSLYLQPQPQTGKQQNQPRSMLNIEFDGVILRRRCAGNDARWLWLFTRSDYSSSFFSRYLCFPSQKLFGLKTGDHVWWCGAARLKTVKKYFALLKVDTINGKKTGRSAWPCAVWLPSPLFPFEIKPVHQGWWQLQRIMWPVHSWLVRDNVEFGVFNKTNHPLLKSNIYSSRILIELLNWIDCQGLNLDFNQPMNINLRSDFITLRLLIRIWIVVILRFQIR